MQRKALIWAAAGAVAVVLILIGAQLALRPAPEGSPLPAAVYAGLPASGTALGPADAPVVVEEYFDFQCPHCQTAAQTIVKPLIERYVEAGTVRFVYRFYPILGPESVYAARAGYCAAAAGSFWPYQQALFELRGVGNRGTYSQDNLVRTAAQIGLDSESFRTCLSGETAQAYVAREYEQAVRLGLPGTPSFVVNGEVIATPSLQAIEQAIERALGG